MQAVANIGRPVAISLRVDELHATDVVVDPAWFSGDRHVTQQRFATEATKECPSR